MQGEESMKTYKLNFSYFLRQKFCILTYIAANSALIAFMIYKIIKTSSKLPATFYVGESLVLTSVIFIMFLFISYYYFSKVKNSEILESISVTATGKNKYYMSMFSVLTTFSLITCAITFLLSIVYFFMTPTKPEYFLFSLKVSLLYFFLADIVAILIGLVCSGIRKKAPAYIILILSAILFSPLTVRYAELFLKTGETALYPIWRLFGLYPKVFNIQRPQYEVAVNTKALFIALFWISLCALIIILSNWVFRTKKSKNISAIICASIFALSLWGAIAPFSEAPQDDNSFLADNYYYKFRKPEKFVIQKNEKADFEITSYDMNFNIKNELKGDVTVYLDKNNLDEYKFTLYHGYRIKNIKDSSGNKLDFKRENDYVTVYPQSNTDTLTFNYKGRSAKYYSNYQGSCLPSGFAYYPINGFHYVFDVSTGEQGAIRARLNNPIPMKVNVECKNKMFCNLDRTEDNSFEGISDGLTLVSGFYDETTVDNTRLVYQCYNTDEVPRLNTNFSAYLKDLLNEYPDYDGKTIIVTPNTLSPGRDEDWFKSSDHITVRFIERAFRNYDDETPVINARLDLFFAFMKYYDKDSELYKLTQMDVDDLPEDDDDLNVILAKKINEYGDRTFNEIINVMGHDEECRTTLEFAKKIGEPIKFQHPGAVN